MNVGKTLFAQVMEFVPWKTFGRIIDRHHGDAGVRILSCADLFRVMAFAQLTWRESLRDIEVCLAARLLRQAVALLVADDFVLIRGQPCGIRIGHLDDLHWNLVGIEECGQRLVVIGLHASACAGVSGHGLGLRILDRKGHEDLAQAHLFRWWRGQAPLALLAKDLPFEPLHLPNQVVDAHGLRTHAVDHLLRGEFRRLGEGGGSMRALC